MPPIKRQRDNRSRSRSPPPRRSRRSRSSSSDRNVYYEQQDYFMRMSKRIHEGFRDDIDREVFAENIMKQVEGKEMSLSLYKHPSQCIQWVIENATDGSTIRALTERMDMSNACVESFSNKHSSQIIQALIESSLKILSKESTMSVESQRHSKWASAYIVSVGEFLLTKLEKLLTDPYGSAVMITFMEALGGIRIGRHWSRKTMGFGMKSGINVEIEKDIVIKELPSNFRNMLKKVAKVAVIQRGDRELKDIIIGKGTQMIQYLLFITKVRNSDLCQSVIKRLVEIIFANQENKFAITTNSMSAYLVEAIMLVSSEHRLTRIWEKHLKGSLKDMWKDDIANFIVQRLVDAAPSERLYQDICEEILPQLGAIFGYNRGGLGVCLAKASCKFPTLQGEFIAALMKAFHCFEPKDRQVHLVPLMLFGENNTKYRREIWLHGSLMLQYIFCYEDAYKVIRSLLSLEPRELVIICNDKSGSHCIDSFLQSQTIAPKQKSTFLDKLRGSFIHLACDRFGSRIVDYLLDSGDAKVKNDIMADLNANEAQLNASVNGFYVGKKAGIYSQKNRQDEWMDTERPRDSRRNSFKEILDEHDVPTQRRFENKRGPPMSQAPFFRPKRF